MSRANPDLPKYGAPHHGLVPVRSAARHMGVPYETIEGAIDNRKIPGGIRESRHGRSAKYWVPAAWVRAVWPTVRTDGAPYPYKDDDTGGVAG